MGSPDRSSFVGGYDCHHVVRNRAHALWLAALWGIVGCSALVSPDTSRLRGDTGPLLDAAMDGGNTPVVLGDAGGGDPPLLDAGPSCECNDGVGCTEDWCQDGECFFSPEDSRCAERQSCHPTLGCVGTRCSKATDCADSNPCTNEICALGFCRYRPTDADGDGDPAASVGGAMCTAGRDCNDGDPSVHSGATDGCNGRDDDCDGELDEDCGTPNPDNDACPNAELLDSVAKQNLSTTLNDARSDHPTSCGTTGADRVYAIPIERAVDIVIDARNSPTPVQLAVATSCSTEAFQNQCTSRDGPARLWVHQVTPEITDRVYLLVKGHDDTTQGDVQLTVRVQDAANDSCDQALDITGGGTVLGFMPALDATRFNFEGTCSRKKPGRQGGLQGLLTARTQGRSTRLRVTGWDFPLELYARSRCDQPSTEVLCARVPAGRDTVEAAGRFPESQFYLFVDGADRSYQSYKVDFRLE